MAFNFTALLGGMASGLSDRIDIEEAKLEKAADRAYTRSEQQRLARRAKREKEKLIAEEMASQLSLYFSPEQASQIMSKGVGAAKEALRMSGDLVSKGYSPQPLFNLSSATDMSDE